MKLPAKTQMLLNQFFFIVFSSKINIKTIHVMIANDEFAEY